MNSGRAGASIRGRITRNAGGLSRRCPTVGDLDPHPVADQVGDGVETRIDVFVPIGRVQGQSPFGIV
ncbi:MAG: hypothetical protein P8179_15760 [Candidatus Thiodiazotropha sp.]